MKEKNKQQADGGKTDAGNKSELADAAVPPADATAGKPP